MKKLLVLLLSLAGFSAVSFAQTPSAEAEELFRAGKFANALSVYEEALKTNPDDAYIYYNIGNCYFKMGSVGHAVANYYRAFKLNPRDGDIRHNLDLALRAGGGRLVPAGMPQALHKLFFYFTDEELAGLTYLLFWLSWAAGVWLLAHRGKRVMVVLACLCVLCAGWMFRRQALDNEALAVVAAPVVEVRSGPGKNFPPSATVAQGHLVVVEDEKDDWYEIIIKAQGLKGWIAKDALKTI